MIMHCIIIVEDVICIVRTSYSSHHYENLHVIHHYMIGCIYILYMLIGHTFASIPNGIAAGGAVPLLGMHDDAMHDDVNDDDADDAIYDDNNHDDAIHDYNDVANQT